MEEMDFEGRIVSPEYVPTDDDVENSLRPKTLDQYVGQQKVKDNLSIYISSKSFGTSLYKLMICSLFFKYSSINSGTLVLSLVPTTISIPSKLLLSL